ncbi:MAG: rhodanese-like domain-containing protein [Actinomycetota bacterium]|nr:rhodanese-like domain-containing protein [Actinomycetota bacterium]
MKSVMDMVNAAKAEVENLSPAEAQRRVEEDGALLVDIRDVRELERDGAVLGAWHVPRGMLEFWIAPDSPYFKEKFAEDRQFIIFCAGGLRSALATKVARDMGLAKAAHIETGFGGWKSDGLPVVDYDTWKAHKS